MTDLHARSLASTGAGLDPHPVVHVPMPGERAHLGTSLKHYASLLRVDHWSKNAFMVLGVILALFYRPGVFEFASVPRLLLALFATCLIASSNYVLNEWLDAGRDRLHPRRRHRAAAQGLVRAPYVQLLWLSVGAAGIALGFAINSAFGWTAVTLWVAGCIYNIPPVRTKDIAYLDVVSESFNNPLRLLLGWYALVPDHFPPLSLSLSYWMFGAFLMAAKRFAEMREVDDPVMLAAYRPVFRVYDQPKLLGSMVFYLSLGALFAGMFVVRYKLELVLCLPLLALFFARYAQLAFKLSSPVQTPERLWREPHFCSYAMLCVVALVGTMFLDIPWLYELFRVEPSGFSPLERIGT